jgi:hypothetical protein
MTLDEFITRLREVLQSISIKSGLFLGEDALYEVLDKRDEPAFDGEWVRVFDVIKSRQGSSPVPEFVNRLREDAFRVTYEAFQDSDLAACVSDDFELLVEGHRLGVEDEWLSALATSYASGSFPRGRLR